MGNRKGIIETGFFVVLLWLALGTVVFGGLQTTSNEPGTYPGQYQERAGGE